MTGVRLINDKGTLRLEEYENPDQVCIGAEVVGLQSKKARNWSGVLPAGYYWVKWTPTSAWRPAAYIADFDEWENLGTDEVSSKTPCLIEPITPPSW